MIDKQICDEEFNKYFEEETNKQTFKIKMEEPMKLIINYDYYFILLKKIERLESKVKMLEKYKDDYKRMKDNFDAKVEVVTKLHEDLEEYSNKLNEVVKEKNKILDENKKIKKELEIKTINNQELSDNIDYIGKLLGIEEGSVIDDIFDKIKSINNTLATIKNLDNTVLNYKIHQISEYIGNLKPLTEQETGIKEMLKLAYKEDNIKNLETSFKTICHLEDFEIAIWNIKDIIEGDIND